MAVEWQKPEQDQSCWGLPQTPWTVPGYSLPLNQAAQRPPLGRMPWARSHCLARVMHS